MFSFTELRKAKKQNFQSPEPNSITTEMEIIFSLL